MYGKASASVWALCSGVGSVDIDALGKIKIGDILLDYAARIAVYHHGNLAADSALPRIVK
jgi:hypothetical protein